MLEDVRRGIRGVVDAGMSAMNDAVSQTRTRDRARSIGQGQPVEQINRIAQELLDWSQRTREWITETIAREVKRQLSAAGIATREDLDALRKRVRELEKAGGKKPATRSGAKRSTPRPARPAAVADVVVETGPEGSVGSEPAAGTGDPTPPAP